MDNETLAQLYRKAQDEGNAVRVREYGDKILKIPDFECEDGITHADVYNDRLIETAKNLLDLWHDDKARKKWTPESALSLLPNIEKAYEKCTPGVSKGTLARCYAAVALLYKKSNDENKQKVIELADRALAHGLSYGDLEDMTNYRVKAMPEDLRSQIFNAVSDARFKQRQAADIERMGKLYDGATYLQSWAEATVFTAERCGAGAILPDKGKEYCIELFKQKLEDKFGSVDRSAVTALTSEKANIEAELVYTPLTILTWERDATAYYYTYEDSYRRMSGSFTYGGGSGFTVEHIGMTIDSAVTANTRGTVQYLLESGKLESNDMKDATYDKVYTSKLDTPSNWHAPDSLFHREDDAKKSVAKQLGVDSYWVKLEKASSPRNVYTVKAFVYVPVYTVRISIGKYVAKGKIDAYSEAVTIGSVACIDGDSISFVGEQKASPDVSNYKPKSKIGPLNIAGAVCGLIALVLGVIMLACGNFTYTPPLILFGFIFAIVSLVKRGSKAGKVCAILGIVTFVLAVVMLIIAFATDGIGCSGTVRTPEGYGDSYEDVIMRLFG